MLLKTKGMGLLFRMVCLGVIVAVSTQPQPVKFQNGDVVLQTSKSSRSALIQKASRSPYSHTGVVEVAPDGVFVIEAIGKVSRTPLKQWAKRGVDERLTVLRLNDLTASEGRRVVAEAKKQLGKKYDARFRWDDERIYCSELVAKAFKRGADRDVGKQEVLKELHVNELELAMALKLGLSPDQTLLTPQSLVDDTQFIALATEAVVSVQR